MDDSRRFSTEEIQDIFRRAAERQQAARGEGDESGLTLAELKQIGEESGLSAAHIEAAAADLAGGLASEEVAAQTVREPRGVERFYRTSSWARVDRVLPGQVDAETWEEMVKILESVFQNAGKTTTAGPIREWHLASSFGFDLRALQSGSTPGDWLRIFDSMSTPTKGPVTVEVRPEGSGTRVEMSYAMPPGRLWEGPGLMLLFLTIAIITTVVSVTVGEPLVLIAPAVMLLLAAGLGSYTFVSHRNEIELTRERLEKAVERLYHLQAAKTGQKEAEPQGHAASAQRDSEDESATRAASSSEPLLDSIEDRPSEAEGSASESPRRTRS
ncbi:hypothetical protein CRI94_14685 [Longibacter salinarum]|uniref:Uncharacterized protein n=1 Tax=Longibacter salinarum TaxID=1850348 RepID=A0A2A8CUY8_9BACT|nr:hypothetical protein [Longibacter salinarum]PEN12277.1 hypothetical protein CRI94_14685 [Longibacter salinarum]